MSKKLGVADIVFVPMKNEDHVKAIFFVSVWSSQLNDKVGFENLYDNMLTDITAKQTDIYGNYVDLGIKEPNVSRRIILGKIREVTKKPISELNLEFFRSNNLSK